MKDVLVLFESESNLPIYEPLMESLRPHVNIEFRIISAHSHLDELKENLGKFQGHAVIAGSGLAAHLPGVCASLSTLPVLGVPIADHLGGLDSLLSVQQMPYGVPVVSTGADQYLRMRDFFEALNKYQSSYKAIDLVVHDKIRSYEYVVREIGLLEKLAHEKGVELVTCSEPHGDHPSIIFVHDKKMIKSFGLHLHVPILDDQAKNNFSKATMIYDWAQYDGLWVGINNSRNALLWWLKWRQQGES